MPKTLLAVDDSTTMRKVLEITFSGEDFQVLTAGNRDAAMGQVGGNPNAVVIDTVLDGDDGYALCKEIRGRLPRAAIVLLSSRYHPYDQGKGRDAGADDYMDKPFDTQQLIEKVKKLLVAKEASGPAPQPTVAAEHVAPTPYRSPAQPVAPPPIPQQPIAAAPPRPMTPPSPPVAPAMQPQASAQSKPRAATLMFPGTVDPPPGPPPAQARVEQHHVAPPPRAAEPATAAPPPIAIAVNGQMAAKLGEMGLTPAQAEAVMALSKDVVERVVWEVVPQLAEILIKEEIARLTKE